MTAPQEQFSQLLAITKNYLLQEHSINERILAETETYSFFRALAIQNQKKQEPKPIIKETTRHALNPPPQNQTIINRLPLKEESQPLNPPTQKVENEQIKPLVEKPPVPKENIAPSTKLKLDLTATAPATDFNELRKIIKEKLPHLHLIDQLPDDSEAKMLAKSWSNEKKPAQVLILSFDEPPKHQLFLANIAKALQLFGFHAVIANPMKIEWQQTLQSKDLKLIVAGSAGFHSLTELQKLHREDPRQGRHYIGDQQLLLLSDISFYLKEPALKPSLWKALKELLTTS